MGQTFLWRKAGEWHYGSIRGALLRVRVEQTRLIAEGGLPARQLKALACGYFATGCDLPALQGRLAAMDGHVARAIAAFPGLRVLQQPLWECLASFILSPANNIRRITRIVNRLSERLGSECVLDRFRGFAFPSPEAVAGATRDALVGCGTGFRARALQEAATAIAEGRLPEPGLRALPYYEQVRERLTALYGVGEKVADCVALYSLHRTEAFPLDVWMRREMERLYFGGTPTSPRHLQEFARRRFGEWAGYAQLYLYHYARHRERRRPREETP
jgi:N-glycosylase/DNA lyase